MLEIAHNLESVAPHFPAVVLVLPGIIAVIFGLCFWLAGLSASKVLAAITGATVALCCLSFLPTPNILALILVVGFGIALAIIFSRTVVVLLTTILVAAVGFLLLSVAYAEKDRNLQTFPKYQIWSAQKYNFSESIDIAAGLADDVIDAAKEAGSKMPFYVCAILALITVFAFVGAIIFRQAGTAFGCSLAGTLLVFAGMILLLLFKGSRPLSVIFSKAAFYIPVFLAMVAFGVIEQLVLCPAARKKTALPKTQPEQADEHVGWRGT